jgi:hypothetical protein
VTEKYVKEERDHERRSLNGYVRKDYFRFKSVIIILALLMKDAADEGSSNSFNCELVWLLIKQFRFLSRLLKIQNYPKELKAFMNYM